MRKKCGKCGKMRKNAEKCGPQFPPCVPRLLVIFLIIKKEGKEKKRKGRNRKRRENTSKEGRGGIRHFRVNYALKNFNGYNPNLFFFFRKNTSFLFSMKNIHQQQQPMAANGAADCWCLCPHFLCKMLSVP